MSEPLALIELEVINRVGWLRYNRPPLNAFNWQMVADVADGLARLSADPQVRVIVIGSAVEKYFSAGAELQEFVDIGGVRMREWALRCHAIVHRLRDMPQPTLAAIGGTAVGGGLEMTLHCDLRFVGAGARFGQPEINIGFIPPIATTQALARLIGRSRAIRYLYDGAILKADEALRIGLVDEVVPDADLTAHVQAYAEALAAKPRAALAAIRRTVTVGGGMSFEDGLALELEEVVKLADDPDFAEGVDAFLAKRKPTWRD
ncbi:MAG: enoyl-CoA hydratase/isomerase family protein [Alphaproteobacteria bacterium]